MPWRAGRVSEIEFGSTGGFVVVAIKKPDGSLVHTPEASIALEAGDVFVVLGPHETLPNLVRRAKPRAAVT
jgi:voltage-gated potassium channel